MVRVIPSDLIETYLKYDNGFTEVKLKLHILDILRIMEICKSAGNMYYYNELRWFLEQMTKNFEKVGYIDFSRKLPRIKLKEVKPWELDKLTEKKV